MSNAPNLREHYINSDGTLTRQGYALLNYIYTNTDGSGSGSFLLDGGTASDPGTFSFDGGGA